MAYFPKWRHLSLWPPEKHFIARKHVVWAIKHENRSNGSTWAQDREKRKGEDRTGQESQKSHKGVIFHLFGEKPPLNRFSQKKLHSSCRPRRNHVCKLLSWNFQGLRFYRGSNFPFSYWFFSWALQQCSASALPVTPQHGKTSVSIQLSEIRIRSSANAEEPCEHTVSRNRVKCCTSVRRIAFEKACNRRMTFKVIQGHCRCCHLIGHILFPISLPL